MQYYEKEFKIDKYDFRIKKIKTTKLLSNAQTYLLAIKDNDSDTTERIYDFMLENIEYKSSGKWYDLKDKGIDELRLPELDNKPEIILELTTKFSNEVFAKVFFNKGDSKNLEKKI